MNAVLAENSPAGAPATVRTTADVMRRCFEIRAEKADLEAKRKALDEEDELLKLEILRQMDEQGSTRVATDSGTAIKTKTILPVVDDWDALYEYVKANDAFHLLQRRVSSPAFREILENGEVLPGVHAFEKSDISLRVK